MMNVEEIRAAARQHVALQADLGREISVAHAVSFVVARERAEFDARIARRMHELSPKTCPAPDTSQAEFVDDVESLRRKAREYIATTATGGREITIVEAIAHVQRETQAARTVEGVRAAAQTAARALVAPPAAPAIAPTALPQVIHFTADAMLHFAADASPGGKGRAFTGTAYSGGIITDHPLFDRVAFDLSSTTIETPVPVKSDHREPIGVITETDVAGAVLVAGQLFSDIDPNARKIADMADRGMPWQMSVGIYPGRVDEIKKGATVHLNGRTFEGPLTVFRNSRIREISFCVLGADDKTKAQVR